MKQRRGLIAVEESADIDITDLSVGYKHRVVIGSPRAFVGQ
jgi:hypothetical protein